VRDRCKKVAEGYRRQRRKEPRCRKPQGHNGYGSRTCNSHGACKCRRGREQAPLTKAAAAVAHQGLLRRWHAYSLGVNNSSLYLLVPRSGWHTQRRYQAPLRITKIA
jgi:hypothetical protein